MRFMFIGLFLLCSSFVAAPVADPASAQSAAGFQAYLSDLRSRAAAAGISQRTLDATLPTLSFNQSIIDLDRQSAGGTDPNRAIPRFSGSDEHRAIFGKSDQGRQLYSRWRSLFQRIESETGVSAGVILAIYGKESNFGSYMGRSDVLSSLATLAYEGRRRSLFEPELIAGLRMIDQGVPRDRLRNGSWAGAMGKPQFLPSVYLRLARDGDGDGRSDIWNSEPDAFVSIAAYLENSGWRRNQPWGIAVNVPSGLNRASIANRTQPTRCPRVFARHSRWLSMAEWRALGFRPGRGVWPDDTVMATLLEPDFQNGPGFLLTQNYRAILDYNCSNFYAMAVGLLADEIIQ